MSVVPMHGIGGRQDLPIPFELVLVGGGLTVVASFIVLGLAWTTPRYPDRRAGLALPLAVTRFIDSAILRWSVRGVGLLIGGYALVAAVFGKDLLINPIFGFVYVLVWVGLVPLSLLFGPVWRTLNPLRSLHLLLAKALRTDPAVGVVPIRASVGIIPAAVGLFAFVWLELVAPDRATIAVLLIWIALYVVIMLFGGVLCGQRWFSAADPFENYAAAMAKLSPWARHHGVLVLRRPLANLDSLAPEPGLVAFLSILLGSTAYDGFSNSTAWIGWAQDSNISGTLLGTAALLSFILVVYFTYTAASHAAGVLAGAGTHSKLPSRFAHSLVPIALGYVIAHYLTLLILEGQRTIILLSDPLSRGWNLLGTAGRGVDTSIINHPTLIATLQVGAVIIGHVLGAVSAHDRALQLFDPTSTRRHAAIRGQLPMLIVMTFYTVSGLLLLFTV